MKVLAFLLLISNLSFIHSITWYGNFANFSSWPIKGSYLSENRQVVNDPKGGTDQVLKVTYPAGSYSKGVLKGGTGFWVYPFGNATVEHATIEYSVLFPNEFDFVKGGKLPGLFGKRTNCTGGDSALDCFSARFMFGPNATGYSYLYVSKTANHTKEFCELATNPTCSPQYGYDLGKSKWFEKEKWARIKEEVKLNTPPLPNGRLTVWVDGVLKFDFDKIIFRTMFVPISGMAFETCEYRVRNLVVFVFCFIYFNFIFKFLAALRLIGQLRKKFIAILKISKFNRFNLIIYLS